MNPATPLPWIVGRDSKTHNRPTRNWETGIDNGDVPVADACGASQAEAHQDAAYIVHACNAYPKLVAALREYVDVVASINDPNTFNVTVKDEGHHARDLLIALGEAQ